MPTISQSPKAPPEAELSARLTRELDAAQDQVRALQRELSNRELDRHALEARVGAIEAAAVERTAAAEARVAAVEARLTAIHGALSWRLMGPFRRSARLMNRFLRRGE